MLALRAHHRLPDKDVRAGHRFVGFEALRHLLRERDLERIRSTGVRCVAACRSDGSEWRECFPAAALAKVQARSAASRAPSAESRRSQANPQAPFRSTRTPMPSLSESESRSTRPLFVATNWFLFITTRASAYSAPAPVAASTAAAHRSRTRRAWTLASIELGSRRQAELLRSSAHGYNAPAFKRWWRNW